MLLRNSQDDSYLYTRGKKLLDLCITTRIRILNGRTIGDSIGQFTCHKHNGSSMIDYAIVSEEMLSSIMYFYVNPFFGHLSDHCCISWGIKSKMQAIGNDSKKDMKTFPDQFMWTNDSIFKFQYCIML